MRTEWEPEREAWLRVHPEPWNTEVDSEYHDRFSGAIERWLDAGHGSCVLRRNDCAGVVAETLRHFDGERIAQIAWVVMPNHVHAVFVLNSAWLLENIILSWKGFAARRINPLIARTGAVLAARLLRSLGSQREALGKLHSLHQTQSQKSAPSRRRICAVRERACEGYPVSAALWKDAAP